jgi:UDP-glucose 4-epimerase
MTDMSKILVTGGAGFIGSHIADALIAQGHLVHIIDNLSSGRIANVPKGAKFHKIDIRDSEGVKRIFLENKFDVVFHQAAQVSVYRSVMDPTTNTDLNVRGIISILEAARNNGLPKIIFASSGGVIYGDPIRIPQSEDHPLLPTSPYGLSKLICEDLLRLYSVNYNIKYVSLRYANVYGPRQNPKSGAGIIAILLEKIFSDNQFTIHGDGKNSRDFIHVSDVVKANILAMDYQDLGAFNIGTGIETNVDQIVQLIGEILNVKIKVGYDSEIAGEQRRSVLDFSRANKTLGWQPSISLLLGLSSTISDYQQRHEHTFPEIRNMANN